LAQGYFGPGAGKSAETATQAESWLPGPLVTLGREIAVYQNRFSRELRMAVSDQQGGVGLAGAVSVIFLSFLYGIFHAAGPGHGKMVTVTYFLTRRGRLSSGLALAAGIALVQALSAILIVGGLSWLLGATSRDVIGMATTIEIGSYVIVVAVGLFMLVNILRGRDACGHRHDHEHGDHDHHHHDHHHYDRTDGGDGPTEGVLDRGNIVGLSLASGLRPCTGAILVLLFTLANGVFLLGIIATLFMGLGVAITIGLIGLGAIAAQRGLFRLLPQGGGGKLSRYLGAAGAVLVMLMGLALLLGTVSGGAVAA
tara:strand:+ start:4703 stop:5635 length:933 start_codon:yes stop_codon:yes gene_type:complete